jgi:hypothetical protein
MLRKAGTRFVVVNTNASKRLKVTIHFVPYDAPTKQMPNQYSIVNNVPTECLNAA